MNKIIFILLLVGAHFTMAYCQENPEFTFERRYSTPNHQNILLDVDTTSSGAGPNSLALFRVVDNMDSTSFGISLFDIKGNIAWSNLYNFEVNSDPGIMGSIFHVDSGMIVFSSLYPSDNSRYLTLLNAEGNIEVSYNLEVEGDINFQNYSEQFVKSDSGFLYIFEINESIYISSFDLNGGLINSQSLTLEEEGVDISIEDAILTKDTCNLLLVSMDYGDSVHYGLIKLDINENIAWAQKYKRSADIPSDLEVYDIAELKNGDLAVSAITTTDTVIMNSVTVLDSGGGVLQSFDLSALGFNLNTYQLVGGEENNIILGGIAEDSVTNAYSPFMVSLNNGDSTIQFSTRYKESLHTMNIGLINVNENGGQLICQGIDPEDESMNPVYIIKSDSEGTTMCEDVFNVIIDYSDLSSSIINLNSEETSIELDTVRSAFVIFEGYANPILSLPDTMYCPNEPILFTLDATTEDATKYEWSDNVNNPMDSVNIVNEEGMYMVTVTVGKDVCYQLCDTANITLIPEPNIRLNVSDQDICRTGNLIINVSSDNAIVSAVWSHLSPQNDSLTTVTISEPGNYSVTITDFCGLEADTTFNIQEFKINAELDLSLDNALVCETGEVTISIDSFPFSTEGLTWSTGETGTTSINVSQPGTYSVEFMYSENCQGFGQISVNESDFEIDLMLDVNNAPVCESGEVRISLQNYPGPISGISWSTGQSGVDNILVSESGTYSVTVSGNCNGNASIDVDESLFDIGSSLDIRQSCQLNAVRLTAFTEGLNNIMWSTGEQSVILDVSTAGDYAISGTNICGDLESLSITVTQNMLSECNVTGQGPGCLEFPNLVVPNSRQELNRIFAPKNNCQDINNYNLKIFNRWGNKVFESNNVDVGWDGRRGNNLAPSTVYFFYATYDSNGASHEAKGDILLAK